MMRRRSEVPPENLGAQHAPLKFPFVTTEKPPDDDYQLCGTRRRKTSPGRETYSHVNDSSRPKTTVPRPPPQASAGRGDPTWTRLT
jgi:hypothetical protein